MRESLLPPKPCSPKSTSVFPLPLTLPGILGLYLGATPPGDVCITLGWAKEAADFCRGWQPLLRDEGVRGSEGGIGVIGITRHVLSPAKSGTGNHSAPSQL